MQNKPNFHQEADLEIGVPGGPAVRNKANLLCATENISAGCTGHYERCGPEMASAKQSQFRRAAGKHHQPGFTPGRGQDRQTVWHIPARRRVAKTVDAWLRHRRMVVGEMVEKKGKGKKEKGKREKTVAGKRYQTVVFLLLPFYF